MTSGIAPSTSNKQLGASLVLVMLILTFLALLTTSLGIKYTADIKRYRGVLLANEMLRTQDLIQTFVNRYATEIKAALKDNSSADEAHIPIGTSGDGMRTSITVNRSGRVLYMDSAKIMAMADKLNIKGLDAHLAAQPYYLEFALSSAGNIATTTPTTNQVSDQNPSHSYVQSLLVRQPRPLDSAAPDPAIIRSALQTMGIGAGMTIPDLTDSTTAREIRFTHSEKDRPDHSRNIPIRSAKIPGLLVLRSVAPHPALAHLPTLGGEKGYFSVHGDTLQGGLKLGDREIKNVGRLTIGQSRTPANNEMPSPHERRLTILEDTISNVGPLNFDIGKVTFGVVKGEVSANRRVPTNIASGTLASKKLEISTPFAPPDGMSYHSPAKPDNHQIAFRLNQQGIPERFYNGHWYSLVGAKGPDAYGSGKTGDQGPKGPRGRRGPKDYVDPQYKANATTKTFTIHFGKDETKWGHHIAKFVSDGEWLSCRLQNHKDTWTHQPKIAYFPPGGSKPDWMDGARTGKPGWYLVRRWSGGELDVEVKCFGLEIVASTQRREPISQRLVAKHEVPIWLEDR